MTAMKKQKSSDGIRGHQVTISTSVYIIRVQIAERLVGNIADFNYDFCFF
jgi:hypothetical protein